MKSEKLEAPYTDERNIPTSSRYIEGRCNPSPAMFITVRVQEDGRRGRMSTEGPGRVLGTQGRGFLARGLVERLHKIAE